MGKVSRIKNLRLILIVALVYAIISQVTGFPRSNESLLLIAIIIQVVIAFTVWKSATEISLSKEKAILLGVLSLFYLVNIIIIIYILKKSNDYLTGSNNEVGDEIVKIKNSRVFLNEKKRENIYIEKNNGENSIKNKKISFQIIIGLNIFLILIILLNIFYTMENRRRINMLVEKNNEIANEFLKLEKITKKNHLFELVEETHYNQDIPENNLYKDDSEKKPTSNNDNDVEQTNIEKFEQLEVIGHETDKSNPYMWTVTGTIKNNSDIDHKCDVQVIFLNSASEPIVVESDRYVNVKSGGVSGFKVTLLDNINNVKDYEINLVNLNN